jgi:capsular exopolysaccharide synthesis family protein
MAQDMDIHGPDLIKIFLRRKWILFWTILFITGASVALSFALTPRYTASLQLYFEAENPSVVDFEAALSGAPQDEAAILSEIEVLKSRKLANRVIESLDLDQDPEFNTDLLPEGVAGRTKDFLAGLIAKLPFGQAAPDEAAWELTEDQLRLMANEQVIEEFLDRLNVEQTEGTRVVTVTFSAENPVTATNAVNALAEFYLVERLESRFENARRASTWLSQRVQELRDEVETSEKLVEEYRNKHGLLQGALTSLVTEQISELNTQLTEAKIQRAEAEANYAQAQRLLRNRGGGISSAIQVLESDLIQYYREQEADLERREAELTQQYGPRHPLMINLKAEKARFQKTVELEVQKIAEALRNSVEIARLREASIQRNLATVKDEMTTANQAGVQLNSLERDAEANRVLLERFQVAYMEANAQQDADSQVPGARIISLAAIPDEESYPDKKLIAAISFVAATVLGILLIFAIEQLESGYRSSEQIERDTGIPVIAHVPIVPRSKMLADGLSGYILRRPNSAYGESIRALYTNVLLSQSDSHPRTLFVSSSEPSEGKSMIALSLARMQAKADRKVILVDTDFRRSRVAEELSLKAEHGLSDVLRGRVPIADAIIRDEASGADILTTGAYDEDLSLLKYSDQISALLDRLKQNYDLVVIDSAPILSVSDSKVVAKMADHTILIVRWGKTRREVVNYVAEQMDTVGARVSGIVLSMIDIKKHARYKYGDSSYYHGKSKKYYVN